MKTIHEAFADMEFPLEKTENSVTAQIKFREDFPGFQGHFPEQKILPAVCSIQLIVHILEKALNLNLYLKSLVKSNFKNPVMPDELVSVNISHENKNNELKVKAKIYSEESIKSSSQMILIPKLL